MSVSGKRRDLITSKPCLSLSELKLKTYNPKLKTLFSEILDKILGRFDELQAMELAAALRGFGDDGSQNFPDFHDEYFAGRNFILQEIYFQIQIPVINPLNNLLLDDLAQLFHVHHKTRIRVRYAFDRYNQFEVMSVIVRIGTGAEYFKVLFVAPTRIINPVSRVKMFYS